MTFRWDDHWSVLANEHVPVDLSLSPAMQGDIGVDKVVGRSNDAYTLLIA